MWTLPRLRMTLPILVLAGGVGCDHSSPAQPSSPPTGTPTPTTASPVVTLTVKADDAGSADPIALLSEVVADASASTGSGLLTFSTDFGDGFVATTANARHDYGRPGIFTINCSVTDTEGRRLARNCQ